MGDRIEYKEKIDVCCNYKVLKLKEKNSVGARGSRFLFLVVVVGTIFYEVEEEVELLRGGGGGIDTWVTGVLRL